MIIISQTPLRVSFVGGGTDIQKFYSQHGGAVLSTAICKYIHVIVKQRMDEKIGLYYDTTELAENIELVKHELIRESMRLTGVEQGIDIIILSDVPNQGTGLGSSSSLTVGLLKALYEYKGTPKSTEEIARQACHIEIDVLGNPIGKQDQYAAAYGGLNIIRFFRDETVSVEPVNMPEVLRVDFFRQLFLVNTGMSRSAGEVLKEVKKNIPSNKDYLIEMSHMPDVFEVALLEGDFGKAAEYLRNAWDLKKRVGKSVSNPAIDRIYEAGLKAGATAGKLLGAGAGGFILFMVPTQEQAQFLNQMSKAYEVMPVHYSDKGTSILYCFSPD